MKPCTIITLGLFLAAGCGNDRLAPDGEQGSEASATTGGGSTSAGVSGESGGSGGDVGSGGSDGRAGAAGAPGDIADLCAGDCAAQEGLDCVDSVGCQDRCQTVYEAVGERGCSGEYTAMLECVTEVDPEAYVCLDANTYGFDENSPCFARSKTLSECLQM